MLEIVVDRRQGLSHLHDLALMKDDYLIAKSDDRHHIVGYEQDDL